jgi:hypothetical protein
MLRPSSISVHRVPRPGLVFTVPVACALALASVGCGSDSGGSGSDDNDAIGVSLDGNDTNSESAGEGNDAMSGDGDGDGDDNGDGDGDGNPGDGDGDPDDGDGNTKWDLEPWSDGNASNCASGNGNGDPEFSFLWAANSSQGTISKIDTVTVTEVGRYQVRPDGAGSPSRTSVSLSGHVAVASRSGGVTKFYATEEDCQESNGMPGIQTSLNNVALPWDQEECRAWHTPFNYSSQRPVAWAPGEWNSGSCSWEEEMLWSAGRFGNNQDEVVLIDGETGVVLETIPIVGLKPDPYGIYGAAVDSEGNFWGTGWADGNHLVRVDRNTFEPTVWDGPSSTGMGSHWYGMTVDVDGYVWNCASRVARFDPMDESWTVSDELPGWSAGCMADGNEDGLLWLGASGLGLRAIDRVTMQIVHEWPTPSSYGVSVDFEGYVWAVNGNGAHKVDPETGQVLSYNGLIGAYTYSDMTGAALSAVGNPSN